MLNFFVLFEPEKQQTITSLVCLQRKTYKSFVVRSFPFGCVYTFISTQTFAHGDPMCLFEEGSIFFVPPQFTTQINLEKSHGESMELCAAGTQYNLDFFT